MQAKYVLAMVVLGLIASVAWGGSAPVPDEEVKALVDGYRERMALGEADFPDVSDSESARLGRAGRIDASDYPECPKFSVVDPAMIARYGSWFSIGVGLEEAANPGSAGSPDEDAKAEGGAPSQSDLAKKSQNPIGDLISLPFENNFSFGAGPGDDFQYVLNIKPVIPIKLNEDWNLITPRCRS